MPPKQAQRANAKMVDINKKQEISESHHKAWASIPGVAQMTADFLRMDKHWKMSVLGESLERIFVTNIIPYNPDLVIDNAMCFALGSISGSENSMQQLVVYKHWVDFLASHYKIHNIYVQDPIFSDVEIIFMENVLGIKVIKDPAAFSLISETTFLFAPFPRVDHQYILLSAAHPAVSVMPKLNFVPRICSGGKTDELRLWLLHQVKVKQYYCKQNFASLTDSPVIFKDIPCPGGWLIGMLLFYPVAPSCEDSVPSALLNFSNVQLKKYYALLPDAIDFGMIGGRSGWVDWSKASGVGRWTERRGFMFNKSIIKLMKMNKLERAEAHDSDQAEPSFSSLPTDEPEQNQEEEKEALATVWAVRSKVPRS